MTTSTSSTPGSTPIEAAPPLIRANVTVPGHAGVGLATDVYRPTGGSAPVVLIRTPYGKARHLDEAMGWARNGFACVVQDVRGRYDSDGDWSPYCHERDDARAVLRWLAEQPWAQDGGVVAYGASYSAFAAWAAAVENPDEVGAVISLSPAMGLQRVKFDPSGILALDEHAGWWLMHGEARTSRARLVEAMFGDEPDLLSHLPVSGLVERFWVELRDWTTVIDLGPSHRPAGDIDDDELARLCLPALHIGGWNDGLVTETLRHWAIVGSDLPSRPPRHLVVGPWGHDQGLSGSARVGDRDNGPASLLPLGRVMSRWARSALAGQAGTSAVDVFVMGENRWQGEAAWPPVGTGEASLYASFDRSLGTAAPRVHGVDRFAYDPLDPFPSRGLSVDRRELAGRVDAVRYESAPLSAALAIRGAPRVELYATTDAPTTDWVVRLIEVSPDGRRLAFAEGCVDAGKPEGASAANGPFHIRLTPTALTVPSGGAIALEITSSDFPNLARNLNTGADRYLSTETRVAHQEVRFGPTSPTRVVLPTGPGCHAG